MTQISDISRVRRALKDVFGFDDFRPGQEAVMTTLLAGGSVLAVMPTGAGKSLCYQVPALVLGGLTIVISPLVALMQDQVTALRLAGVAADTINSSIDRDENVAAWRRVITGETRLLYLAPERLMAGRMLDSLRRLYPSAETLRRAGQIRSSPELRICFRITFGIAANAILRKLRDCYDTSARLLSKRRHHDFSCQRCCDALEKSRATSGL